MGSILDIKIKGCEELEKRLNSIDVENKVDQALRWGANKIEYAAKRIVRVDTGELKASINTWKPGRLQYNIGSSKDYAAAQEFGRPDLLRYRFRPYLRPAAEMTEPLIEQKIVKLLEGKKDGY